jgi:radical SAM superfamily enzyme YgiQ (UPF0313 family)
MRVLFVDNFPFNFGLASLSSVLKGAGHQVELLSYPFSKWNDIDQYAKPEKYFSFPLIGREILSKKPDIVAFSVFSANFVFYKRLVDHLKGLCDIPILVGGVYPTLNPDLLMTESKCDFLFRGEAEPVVADLVTAIHAGTYHRIPNLVYRTKEGEIRATDFRSYLENLDALPFYDKELYPIDSPALYMITSRGCALKCAYCSAGQYTKTLVRPGDRLIRKRGVDAVITEIKEALRKKAYREVIFYDDFFISSHAWLEEFAARYKAEIPIPYSCLGFPGALKEPNVRLLAESGCRFVYMGFQTANENYKREVLGRRETNASVREAIENLKRFGIKFSIDHIFNLPGETRMDIERSLDFYLDNGIREIAIYFLNYYPESPITRYAHERGYLTQEQYEQILKCTKIGEQSFKGTILDKNKSRQQVRYALLFRAIDLLPAAWVRRLFRWRLYRFFPTDRYSYYLSQVLVMLRYRGWRSALAIVYFSLPFIAKVSRRKVPSGAD